jgi:dienelactone hydrolase
MRSTMSARPKSEYAPALMTDYRAALEDFTETTFTSEGKTRAVFRKGTGPAVIVIHEIPGITPEVADFGRRVTDAGFTAVLPVLFGEPGRPMSVPYVMQSFGPACVSKEFAALATSKTSPITVWLRALGAEMHEECGGPGIGAVGMCFTGGFALGMMVDDTMLAPVLSQPSLPFPVSPARHRSVGISDVDLARVKERAAGGACLMGLRFTEDMAVPDARFATLRRELGDAFIAVEIDSSKGNANDIPRTAHSVLTEHFVDEPGHPTRDALDRVLAFFGERLALTP